MTNHSPRITIPIQKNQNIDASSTQPKVTTTHWSANEGYQLQRDIQKAAEIALQQQQLAEREAQPENLRIAQLEKEVSELKRQFVEWSDLYGKK